MGKRKLEMKPIEKKSNRQVTFSKRRNGLMKKARELSVLCDAKVAVVIFSSPGKLYDFCNGDSLIKVLQQYWDHVGGTSCTDSKPELRFEIADILSGAAFSQFVKRNFDVAELEHLGVTDLMELEKLTHAALQHIRLAKMQLWIESATNLKEKEQVLRKENELLKKQIAAFENSNDINKMVTVSKDCDRAVGSPA